MASMIRYQPFRFPLSEMTRDLDRVFDRLIEDTFTTGRGAQPRAQGAANLWETPEAYWVELALPGVKPDDVEVTVQENVLTLSAKRTWQAPENAKAIWQGFGAQGFTQRFTLPGEVNPDRVAASLEHGVLKLELPKAEHVKPRTIRINGDGAAHQVEAAGPAKQIEQPEQPAS